ncbi:MAG: polyprenyl synthetase family protein [Prolixibacteraceae bacterium]|nr:polyprenyl synthetase family protein [Burkholderiales bacterium]
MLDRQGRIEKALHATLPASDIAPSRLHSAMRYAVLGAGKRVRPLLAYGAGELSSAQPQRVDVVAAAVEMIHAYSLVHDDMPAMDADVLRRGRPTVHVEFDEATALLVGDSLQSLAFQMLSEHRLADDARRQLEMVELLARASGSRGMAGGQAIDLESTAKTLAVPELEFMHIHKTGALIRASVALGARCGNALSDAQLNQLDHFSKFIGLAFQVVDDVLDADSNTATLGKTAGKDACKNKPTYVSALGLQRARELAQELRDNALRALDSLPENGGHLRQLATFIVTRKF